MLKTFKIAIYCGIAVGVEVGTGIGLELAEGPRVGLADAKGEGLGLTPRFKGAIVIILFILGL